MARTAEDILKEAILLEMRGKAFYSSVADKTESKSAKKIFEQMASEEEEHIAFLSKQFQNFVKNKQFLGVDDVEQTADDEASLLILTDDLRKEISAASFEAAAISSAIDFEYKAIKLYSERAAEATDSNEIKIYEMLARWEEGHAKALVQLNEALKEDIWNDNSFWPF